MLKAWKERKSRLAVLILHVNLFKLSEKSYTAKKYYMPFTFKMQFSFKAVVLDEIN